MNAKKWLLASISYCVSIGCSLFGVTLLLSSLLLFTHVGNQALIKVAKQFESRLSIQLDDGMIFHSPRFSHISWLDGDTELKISSANYQFEWACLLKTVCLETLNVDGVQIKLAEPTPQSEPEVEESDPTPLAVDIPIAVAINGINVSQLHVEMGELIIDLDKFSLQANAFAKDISLATQLSGLLINLPDAPPALPSTKNTPASQVKTRKDLTLDAIPALLTAEMLPAITLPITLNVDPSTFDDVQIVQNKQTLFQLNHLTTAFTFEDSELTVSQFAMDLPETDLNLSAKVNFTDDYPLQLHIDGQLKKIKQLQPQTLLSGLDYRLVSRGSLSDLNTDVTLSNAINLQLQTTLDLLSDNLPHKIALHWQALHWPLTGEAQYSAKQGSFSSQGSMLDHRIAMRSDYALANMPSGVISLKTQGDLDHLQVESLKVETLSGVLDFSGLLSWQDRIDWLGQLQITEIDLAPLKTEYDGHFSGLIKQQVAVTLYDEGPPDWQFELSELTIFGELLSRPFLATGALSGDDQQGIHLDSLTVNNAQNSLVIDGVLAQQNDLNIEVAITDLSHAVVDLNGKVNGNVQIKGPADALQVSSKLTTQALSYQDYQVEKIDLASQLILSPKPQLRLDLSAQKINVADQVINDASLTIRNKPSSVSTLEQYFQHQIGLAINSGLFSSDSLLFVTQTDNELLAQLDKTEINLGQQRLSLATAVELSAQQNQIDMTPHCWQASTATESDAGKLCVKQFSVGESGDVVIDIDEYQLASLNLLLPSILNINGALSADADLHWLADKKPNFNVNLLSDNTLLKIKRDNESELFTDYPMQRIDISLKGNEQVIDVNATIFADKLVDMNLNGQLHSYQTDATVNAQLSSSLPDFSLFLPLIPVLGELKGSLDSELNITGKLEMPEITGAINIQDGALEGEDLPIKISKLGAVITIEKNRAKLQSSFDSSDTNTLVEKVASASLVSDSFNLLDKSVKNITDRPLIHGTLGLFEKSVKKVSDTLIDPLLQKQVIVEEAINNPGVAYINGNLDWSNDLNGDIHFYARKLEVYDYGKIDLLLSPDIHLLLNEHMKIDGELLIDKGKVVVKELPEGAISQSEDIVVIDIEKEKVDKAMPVIIDLSVDTGSELQIIALGLDTFMEGQLTIQKPLEKDLTINGVLALSDGSYQSLGQQLVLQNSRVIFQGAPEAPYLQIEAIRDPSKIEDDVTAGVRVTGTPDELELVIFSDPAMAQQEALSYLTRGQAIGSSSDGGTMANMLIDLAAGQSGGVMSRIGEEIGIKDLSLASSGSGDEQSVGISGEIAPGVELSYGIGVFDSFSILSLRYELFKRFYVEASSGIHQAVDAYYEWDWD